MDFTEFFKQNLMKCSPCGSMVATLVQHRLVIRDAESLQIKNLFNNPSAATGLEWSPDSKLVLAFCTSKSSKSGRGWIRIYSISDESWHAEIDAGISGLIRCLFAPDGRHLFAWSEFQLNISIYSLISSQIWLIKNPKTEKAFCLREDGRYFAYCERAEGKDFLGIVDCRDWSLLRHFPLNTIDLEGLSWSPDGKFIVAYESMLNFKLFIYSPDGFNIFVIRFYQFTIGRLISTFAPNDQLLGCAQVKWSPSSQFLAIFGMDQKITILNTLTWFPSLEISHPSTLINDQIPAFKEVSTLSSNGTKPGSFANSIPKYQLMSYPVVLDSSMAKESISVLMEWSKDGRYIASKSDLSPASVFIFDLDKLDYVAVLIHQTIVKQFEWNPVFTDQLLINCSSSNSLYTWSPMACTIIQVPLGGFEVSYLQWSPNGKSLLVGDKEKFCVAFPID